MKTSQTADWKNLRFDGKSLVLAGNMMVETREKLTERIEQEGGIVADAVTASTWAVVIGETRGSAAAVKEAVKFNKKGASIKVMERDDLYQCFTLTDDEARAMLAVGGSEVARRWRPRMQHNDNMFGCPRIDLTGIDLRSRDLRTLCLENITLDGADFRKADLREASLPEVKDAKFDGADLRLANIGAAVECSFAGCNMTGAHLWAREAFTNCDLTDAVLREMKIEKITCAILKNTDFSHTFWDSWNGWDAKGLDLRGLNFDGAQMAHSDFSGACLADANLHAADLSQAKFSMANLRGAILKNSCLKQAMFQKADLTNADFTGADLVDADLSHTIVTGADFTGAKIDGVKLDGVNAAAAKNLTATIDVAGPCVTELAMAISTLTNRFFFHADIDIPTGCAAVDITAYPNHTVDVYYELFAGNKVTRESGSGSTIAECISRAAKRFQDGWLRMDEFKLKATRDDTVPVKKLTELVIAAWCEAMGTTPAEATAAQPAKLAAYRDKWIARLKTDPTGIDAWNRSDAVEKWRCGTFAGADLSGLKLPKIRFYEVDLCGAVFDNAKLAGSDFSSCDLKKASFKNASLSKAKFGKSKLNGADFSNADLTDASLGTSTLTGAIFVGADLTKASLMFADLRGADLSSSTLKGTDFLEAMFDENTKFPARFKTESLKWKGKGLAPLVYQPNEPAEQVAPVSHKLDPIDFDTFMDRLGKVADFSKLKKALSMLKKERFQLYSQVTESSVAGIVKSQTEPDLVYSCKLASDGSFACCTQNLNICGGLRGGLCKHLLVMLIGLAKGGQIAPELADAWAAISARRNPELDKNAMSETFLRYKGAEAGEVDWRPTETVPEDYYAV